MKSISLSNNTVQRRIDDIAADIKSQIINKLKLSPFFAISCDESTDITNYAQLIVYVRYISGDIIEEEILYSQSLTAGTKSEDIFNSISDFIKKNDLDWNKLIGLCTDGAPVMIGVRSGLAQKLKEKNPSIVSTHCVIHRQALASKTLPQNLRQILDSAIQIVNYIRSSALNSRLFTLLCEDLDSDHRVLLFHTEVRWLSKGNMLARLYELKEEVILFLEFKEKNIFLQMFKNEQFQCKLAYLADIFDTLNQLNLKLQGQNGTSISNYDHIQGFISKLQLWDQKVSAENLLCFSRLYEAIKNKKLDEDLKIEIITHLQTLVSEFQHYYRDINSESPIWHMTRNPFVVDVLQLPEEVQEEFLEMKADSTMKDDFHLLTLEKFWIKRFLINPKVASLALRILLPFSSTYMCETGFSALVLIKTKQRNRLAVDSDLTITLAKTVPRIDKLVQNVQAQVSH
ncbi:zinc finger BED domain-containing protein 5-like [Neodiprion pinetum]|uniref:zinc finger BED domain-containing protein 5-like n=1 Tax=Neodiprion pinetum TaxID=441929 RepID=UPI003721C67A